MSKFIDVIGVVSLVVLGLFLGFGGFTVFFSANWMVGLLAMSWLGIVTYGFLKLKEIDNKLNKLLSEGQEK